MPVPHRFTAGLAALAALLAAGCEPAAVTWPPVTVADGSTAWHAPGTARVLEARVAANPGWVVDAVYVRHARHFWPGAPAAHDAGAELVDAAQGLWRAMPGEALAAWDADRMFWQWFVDFRMEGGQDVVTVSSVPEGGAPHDMVVGCTDADIDATLEQMRTVLARLNPANGQLGDNPGYLVPSHVLPVSLAGQGVPYAAQGAAGELGSVALDRPGLLLYAPRPRGTNESAAAYLAAITDGATDPPYTLLGVGYGVLHQDPQRRPRLGCVPSDEWFVHEAGWHLFDGGFLPTPPAEGVPGAVAVGTLLPPAWVPPPCLPIPGIVTCPPGSVPPGTAWHPRIWDIHAWVNGTDAPVLAIDVPGGQPGLPVPAGSFFRPQTFE